MTHREIDQLDAGREMDALIAEKVFGHTVDRAGEIIERETPGEDPRIVFFNEDRTAYTLCPVVPRYSTDISAAWLVVEKMRADGWFYSVGDVIEINEHLARFFTIGQPDAQAMSESAPVVICRAALKAVTPDAPEPAHREAGDEEC